MAQPGTGRHSRCFEERSVAEERRKDILRVQPLQKVGKRAVRYRIRPCRGCGGWSLFQEARKELVGYRGDWGGTLVSPLTQATLAATVRSKLGEVRDGDNLLQVSLFYSETPLENGTWALDHARLSTHPWGGGIARIGTHYDEWFALPILNPDALAVALINRARHWSIDNLPAMA